MNAFWDYGVLFYWYRQRIFVSTIKNVYNLICSMQYLSYYCIHFHASFICIRCSYLKINNLVLKVYNYDHEHTLWEYHGSISSQAALSLRLWGIPFQQFNSWHPELTFYCRWKSSISNRFVYQTILKLNVLKLRSNICPNTQKLLPI